jgi:hypothetical protein
MAIFTSGCAISTEIEGLTFSESCTPKSQIGQYRSEIFSPERHGLPSWQRIDFELRFDRADMRVQIIDPTGTCVVQVTSISGPISQYRGPFSIAADNDEDPAQDWRRKADAEQQRLVGVCEEDQSDYISYMTNVRNYSLDEIWEIRLYAAKSQFQECYLLTNIDNGYYYFEHQGGIFGVYIIDKSVFFGRAELSDFNLTR